MLTMRHSHSTTRLLFGLATTAAMLAATPLHAWQIPHGQDRPPGPPLSPAEAVAKMTVPEGFHVEIVAAEPQIVNPVAMTFDERGRIWVTESFEYPRREPGPGRDRIKVLEDADGDGKVDKVTIFADGLNIPSGIAVGYGGVWVANAPDILFLQDIDGDDKADRQEVVVTGFGRHDTHELPNSFTWGPDGWLYGLNGVFNFSHVKYPDTSPHFKRDQPGWPITCAMFRIHPRTREFEVFCEGTSNPWGIAFNEEGSAFVSACVIDHLWHLVETGYYHRQAGAYPPFTWKIESIVKHKHQKAAYCGLHFFDSDAYPEPYREKLYMGNIHGGCINVDKLQRNGSTYFATGEPDFLTANDAWFMPVVQKTGPDGSLYILDWYDRYHCYQDANRDPMGIDRAKGRLYRVVYGESKKLPPFDLARESNDDLAARLRSPNLFYRDLAQRLLAERLSATNARDIELVEKLEAIVTDRSLARKFRLHALFALIGGRAVRPDLHGKLVREHDGVFRAWLVRSQRGFSSTPIGTKPAAVPGPDDPSPDVRLALAISAAHSKPLPDANLLLHVLHHSPGDELIPRIVWKNLLPVLESKPESVLTVIKQIKPGPESPVLAMMPRMMDRILSLPGASFLVARDYLDYAMETRGADARGLMAMMARKVQTGEISGARLNGLRNAIGPRVAHLAEAGTAHPLGLDAALLTVTWGDKTGLKTARQTFATTGLDPALRLRAFEALVAANDADVVELAARSLAEPVREPPRGTGEITPVQFRARLLEALGKSTSDAVAGHILAGYDKLEPELQPRVIELLTSRKPWSLALLRAIGEKKVPQNALNVNQVRKLLASNDAELAKLVGATWGVIREGRDPGREKVIADMRRFARETRGDALKGKAVFDKVCGQCHKMYGEGQEVGPDITSNGRASFEQLLSNLFDPSLVVGAGYQAYTVVTTDGVVVSGLLVEDSPQRVVLKVQGGKLETIPRDKIDEAKRAETSLMPEGLEKQLMPEELADLLAYVTLDRPPTDPQARLLPGTREIQPRATRDPAEFNEILAHVAPGFSIEASGEGGVALLKEHAGRPEVVQTHPVDRNKPAVLRQKVALPAGTRPVLQLSVGHHAQGDWQLVVKVDGKAVAETEVGKETADKGWKDLKIDLAEYAGREVTIELLNQPTGWAYEFAYWARAEVVW